MWERCILNLEKVGARLRGLRGGAITEEANACASRTRAARVIQVPERIFLIQRKTSSISETNGEANYHHNHFCLAEFSALNLSLRKWALFAKHWDRTSWSNMHRMEGNCVVIAFSLILLAVLLSESNHPSCTTLLLFRE